MLTQEHAQALVHATAYDASGNKLGKIGQIYLDNRTQAPEWATVHTGFFGNHESFVPLADAELDGHRLRLPFAKEQVKSAPELDPAAPRGGLTPDQELDLYRHYGVDAPRPAQPSPAWDSDTGRTSSFGPATALADRPETFDEPQAPDHPNLAGPRPTPSPDAGRPGRHRGPLDIEPPPAEPTDDRLRL